MSNDYDQIAAIEKAIKEKYGDDAIANPKSNWNEEKEKEYLEQMRLLYDRNNKREQYTEKVDVNGVSLIKFECCSQCYIQYVEGREERWLKGWRPNNGNSL